MIHGVARGGSGVEKHGQCHHNYKFGLLQVICGGSVCCNHAIKHVCDTGWVGEVGARSCAGLPMPHWAAEVGKMCWPRSASAGF